MAQTQDTADSLQGVEASASAVTTMPTGSIVAYVDSLTLITVSGMPSEPPDADPHVRWCGRRRGEPGPYPIWAAEPAAGKASASGQPAGRVLWSGARAGYAGPLPRP